MSRAAPLCEPKRRHGVGNDEPFDGRIGEHFGGAGHEQAMRHQRDHPARSRLPGRTCGAQQRAAGADQIVDHERGRAGDVADEEVAGDDAGAAMLVGECLADRTAERSFQRLAKQLRPLGAAGIRRHHAQSVVLQRADIIDEQRRAGERDGAAAKGVLECHRVVNFERDDAVGPDRLEHSGNVAGGDRIVRLGATILARIAKVRHDRRDASGARVLERPDEEQQPAELVVGAFGRSAVKALDDVDIGAADGIERAHLVLAVLECALLMRGELLPERQRDGLAKIGGRFKREQADAAGEAGWSVCGNRMGAPSSSTASFHARGHACRDHASRRGFAANTVDVGATHTKRLENRARLGDGAIDIDAAAGVLDHHHIEAFAPRVFGRVADAEIKGETRQEDTREAALAQVAGQSRMCLAVVLEERRIGVDVAMVAFAQDQLCMRDLQVLRELGPGRSLHAMIRPQDLRPVGRLDRFDRASCPDAWRQTTRWPGGCQSCVSTTWANCGGQPIDQRHDLIATGNGERAARTEVILDVDDQQDIVCRQ